MNGSSVFCITGASGFVGWHALARLARAAGAIRALTRCTAAAPAMAGVEWIQGDLRERNGLERLLRPETVVINLAFLGDAPEEEMRALAEQLAAACAATGVRRLVHVSTADVAGAAPGLVDEDTQCRPVSAYECSKFAFESALREARDAPFDLVILRPTAVFGRGGRNLVKLARQVAAGGAVAGYLRACFHGHRAMNLVPVETVADAVAFAALREQPFAGAVLLVAADDAPENNYRDVEACLRDAFGQRPRPLPALAAPRLVQSVALRAAGRSNTDPERRFSDARLRQLGFRPAVAFAAALRDYAAHLAAQWRRDGTVSG